VAGRHASQDLKCTTCHRVAGDDVGHHPTITGPALGSMQATQSADEIAGSIVDPSHVISAKDGDWRETTLSKMGDYRDVMTVQQLIDIVAYLKSPPGQRGATSPMQRAK